MRRICLSLFAVAALLASTACGIDKTTAPGMSGPSEFGTSLVLTASPDLLRRDGVSQSTISITARDSSGEPLANRALRVFTDAGRLSSSEVTTGNNGIATVQYTAPGVNENVLLATVSAAPAGGDWSNFVPRSVDIRIVGPSIPVADFNVIPTTVERFLLTTFDATPSTVGGQPCGSECTFTWDFGGEGTATGRFATHRFQQEATYPVTLTVTTTEGASATKTKSVSVGAADLPVPRIRFSPTNQCVGLQVNFNGSESTAANGADIVEYEWDFGDGNTAGPSASATATNTYNQTGSFIALLTVTDSNGLKATVSATVPIRALSQTTGTCN